MRRVFVAFIIALVSLVSGCAIVKLGPLAPDPEFSVAPGKGAIVFSQTATAGKHTLDSWFYFQKKGTTNTIRTTSVGIAVIMLATDFPDLDDRIGRVQVLAVEPGEYELVGWQLYVQTFGGYGHIGPIAQLSKVTFRVDPDQAIYIGRLHVETLTGRNIFGLEIPAGGKPECADKSEEDLKIFRTKYPRLRDFPVRVHVLDLSSWITG